MRRIVVMLSACTLAAQLFAAETPATPPHWTASAAVTFKETYDDNVFLQELTSLAHRSSLVTAVAANVAASYPLSPLFNASLTYAPEWSIFHSEHSEDNINQRFGAAFTGKQEALSYELSNSLIWIDGSDQGLFFTGPGGSPAIGGIPVRDRRDARIYRSGLKVKWLMDDWMVRPNGSAYYHDFRTQHRTTAFYQNSVDRSEYVAGLDLGYQLNKTTLVFAGYRTGHQTQALLNGVNLAYSSTLQRAVLGIEGSPAKWIKLAVAIGPDYRRFQPAVAAGFHRSTTKIWSDSSVTLNLSTTDTVTLVYKRLYLPAFTGRNVYEDITAEVQWKHVINDKLSASLGIRDYSGFFETGNRRDIIYTYNGGLSWKFDKVTTIEAAYSHDETDCARPGVDVSGREFTRNLVSLGLKRSF